jgi:nucleoside-diphosphate-sugar epimerase
MSRVLVTSGPGVVGSRVILRLLAASRELRTLVGSRTRASEVLDAGDVQARARVSFIEADRDHYVERLDAVAGGEFLDDRIRLRE